MHQQQSQQQLEQPRALPALLTVFLGTITSISSIRSSCTSLRVAGLGITSVKADNMPIIST